MGNNPPMCQSLVINETLLKDAVHVISQLHIKEYINGTSLSVK